MTVTVTGDSPLVRSVTIYPSVFSYENCFRDGTVPTTKLYLPSGRCVADATVSIGAAFSRITVESTNVLLSSGGVWNLQRHFHPNAVNEVLVGIHYFFPKIGGVFAGDNGFALSTSPSPVYAKIADSQLPTTLTVFAPSRSTFADSPWSHTVTWTALPA